MEPQAISSDLIRGHIDTIILYTLLDSDKFAQQISDAVEEKSQNEYKLNQATLYSSLKRLENLKYVVSYWNDCEGGRRKYFKLTESGRNAVQSNISNWSHSRSIIDKLMDCSPAPVSEPQIVEKIVEIEKQSAQNTEVSQNLDQISNTALAESVLEPESKVDASEFNDNSQDINFRNILVKLVQPTTARQQVEELEPLSQEDVVNENVNEKVEVQKFIETLDTTDYNAQRNNNGKIDFGDLTLKAAKEGYKLNISAKDSFISNKTLLINKLNLITSTLMFLISTILFFTFKLIFVNYVVIDKLATLITLLCFITPPFINAIIYAKKPKKTTNKQPSADAIFVSLIVVFNLILITFAVNLLFGVDFSDVKTILFSMVFPAVIYVLIVVHFIVKLIVSKNSRCKIRRKSIYNH